jgi:glycosyltransferase 2 family protein
VVVAPDPTPTTSPAGARRLRRVSRRTLLIAQVTIGILVVAFVSYEVAVSWRTLRPRLEAVNPWHVAAATGILTVYYLVFVIGWMIVLNSLKMRARYRDALGAEMISMLAKYVPGGVWTPAARIVACRKFGLPGGPVLASIGYEAGLSAVAGVVVFVASLAFAPTVALPIPIWALAAFVAVLTVALHPRVYGPLVDRLLRRLGDEPIPRLALRTTVIVLVFYCTTWPIGGFALREMLLAFGASVPVSAVFYLGGASAIGAIVAVLVVFAPSGLGVREGAVFALLLAYTDRPTALVVVALNRILITLVEAALFGVVVAANRRSPAPLVEPIG